MKEKLCQIYLFHQNKLSIFFLSTLILCIFIFLIISSQDTGPALDEPIYVSAGQSYVNWLLHPKFNLNDIEHSWYPNHEHPPFAKIIPGIFGTIFGKALGLIYACRIGINLIFCILLFLIYSLTKELTDQMSAYFALISTFFSFHLLGHAQVANLDLTTAFSYFLCTYWFLKINTSKFFFCSFPFILTIGLLTKINCFFLLPLCYLWSFFYIKMKSISRVFYFCLLPLILFFLCWPWLWNVPPEGFITFLFFHATHINPPTFYFGNLGYPPWHYPFVIIGITTPLIILIISFLGLTLQKWNKDRLFLFSAFLLPLLVQSLPNAPKYDGERLFLNAFPFIALFSGIGFFILQNIILKKIKWSLPVFLILFLSYHTLTLYRLHPYYFTYFNELIGGRKGAYNAGMLLSYWGIMDTKVIVYLNENLPKNSSIQIHDFLTKYTYPYYTLPYFKKRILREDITLSDNPSYLVIINNGIRKLSLLSWKLKDPTNKAWELEDPTNKVLIKTFDINGFPLIKIFKNQNIP